MRAYVIAHACNLSSCRLRQGNCAELETSRVSEQDPASNRQKQDLVMKL